MPFPNTRQVARFDPLTLSIVLNETHRDALDQDLKAKRHSNLREPLSTIFHEITHWADTVGTLWGNTYLSHIFDAMTVLPSVDTLGAETEFYKLMTVRSLDRRLNYPAYYRLQFSDVEPHSHKKRWRIEFSAGLEFDSNGRQSESQPLIFVKLSDNETGAPIVRQPLCIAALLETTAVWSEIATQIQIIDKIPGDEKILETALFKKDFLSRLYAEDLTLYTAPVHLLAQYASITDTSLAYHLGALVSLVCLNLVGSHFRKLKEPDQALLWRNRFTAFKRIQSIPFAYFCICANAPKWTEKSTPGMWLEAALANSGLPTFKEIMGHAAQVLSTDEKVCNDAALAPQQAYLRQLGARWLASRSETFEPSISLHKSGKRNLSLPPMFDADGLSFLILGSDFDTARFNQLDLWNIGSKLHTQILKFSEACR